MASGDLHRIFLNNASKRLDKWIHYFDIYERHLARFRGTAPVMLEIGVHGGGSLQMWREYLGPEARIIGVDINPKCKQHESEGIEVFIGSQEDPELMARIREAYPHIDIVLDDGSHVMRHMIATFELMYAHVQPNGVYMVEDTHTCYWPRWGGGLKREGTFIEFVKDKLDEINAAHSKGQVEVTDFTRSTDHLAIYDSVVAFEKRPQGLRQALKTFPM